MKSRSNNHKDRQQKRVRSTSARTPNSSITDPSSLVLSDDIPVYNPATNLSKQQQMDYEFGPLESKDYLYVSQHPLNQHYNVQNLLEPSYFTILLTYLNYLILIVVGNIKDFFGVWFDKQSFDDIIEKNGYAPYYSRLESFYVRRLKRKIDDNFSIPTTGVPGRHITCYDRASTDYNKCLKYTGNVTTCLNLASYNYLGFAQSVGRCTNDSLDALYKYGTSAKGPKTSIASTDLLRSVEKLVAEFVGKDDSVIFSQGFATNCNLFNTFLNSDCLIFSDELNHSSIRTGLRISGATIKIFNHNNMKDLEKKLRKSIVEGQPRSKKPWKKILVCVEGLYSMEGTMCPLPQLIELKSKYKFFLFVDEAHSIGAMGPHGRGVCDYFNIDPQNIDILMGTFTKSFGAAGGYVAASQDIINYLRVNNLSDNYAELIPPAVLQQISTSTRIIMGELNGDEGIERIQRIAFNSRYLRAGLRKLGFIAFGMDDSPVIPVLLYVPNKLPAVARALYKRGIAVVIVGYPATSIVSSRIRICVSASLTKSDLDQILSEMDYIGDKLYFKYAKHQKLEYQNQDGTIGDLPFPDHPEFLQQYDC